MALKAFCDICGMIAKKNAASDGGLYLTRGTLTIRVTVVKTKGAEPIICARCVQLAAAHGDVANGNGNVEAAEVSAARAAS